MVTGGHCYNLGGPEREEPGFSRKYDEGRNHKEARDKDKDLFTLIPAVQALLS